MTHAGRGSAASLLTSENPHEAWQRPHFVVTA